MPVDYFLRARQLIRFAAAEHPFSDTITADDVAYAHRLQPDYHVEDYRPRDEEEYPPNWAVNQNSIRGFLSHWRAHQKDARARINFVPKNKEPEQAETSSSAAPVTPPPTDVRAQQPDPTPTAQLVKGLENFGISTPTEERRREIEFALPPSTGQQPSRESSPFVMEPQQPDNDLPQPRVGMTNDELARMMGIGFGNARRSDEDFLRLMGLSMDQIRRSNAEIIADAFAGIEDRMNERLEAASVSKKNEGLWLKPVDVGHFDPDAEDTTGAGMTDKEKVTVFTDVHPFVNRLKGLEVDVGQTAVKKVWTNCLKGQASVWYNYILTDDERADLSAMTIDEVCDKLIDEFKIDSSVAMKQIARTSFGMRDVLEGHNIVVHIQSMMKNAKSCEIGPYGQMLAAWNTLDPDIQSELTKPDTNTRLNDFLREVRTRESVIKGRADKKNREQAAILNWKEKGSRRDNWRNNQYQARNDKQRENSYPNRYDNRNHNRQSAPESVPRRNDQAGNTQVPKVHFQERPKQDKRYQQPRAQIADDDDDLIMFDDEQQANNVDNDWEFLNSDDVEDAHGMFAQSPVPSQLFCRHCPDLLFSSRNKLMRHVNLQHPPEDFDPSDRQAAKNDRPMKQQRRPSTTNLL
jgi:hypothetical protein